ncbi:hypothetical protein ACOSQ2_023085 [Xanthoceras sorbifolium]
MIEVDVTKPFRGTLKIDDRRVMVEYESMMDLICFNCGRIGHGRESYNEGIQSSQKESVAMETEIIPPP